MSIPISFEEDGGSGLVALGTPLWDAAKRLGIRMRAECKGLGQCEGCVVRIVSGSDSLSPATEAELKILGAERLLGGERLACQTRFIKAGAVTAQLIPPSNARARVTTSSPFKQQVGDFIESEAKSVSEAMNMIRGKTNQLVEKFLNLNPPKVNAKEKVAQSDATDHESA
jgi:ferredoxin